MLLRAFGLDPASAGAHHAVRLVREHCRWEHDGEPFFAGEVEPCINGRTVAIGAYFGEDVEPIVARLLGEQMSDGGWNCEQENGSTRGSFHTTIDVLEGLPLTALTKSPKLKPVASEIVGGDTLEMFERN